MGKKSKKKQKNAKPDQFQRIGCIDIARFQNITVLENRLTKEEHIQLLKGNASRLPEIITKINSLINDAVNLIRQHNKLSLLYTAYQHFLISYMGKETETEIGTDGVTALSVLEYIQSIIASVNFDNVEKSIDEESWKRLIKIIDELYRTIRLKYHICKSSHSELYDPEHDKELEIFLVNFQMYWCTVRSKRYFVHDIPYLKHLLIPHNDIFVQLFNISIHTLLEELDKIQFALSEGVGDSINKLKKYHKEFIEYADRENLDFSRDISELTKEFLTNTDALEDFESAFHRAYGLDNFNLSKITSLPKSLLSELSWNEGEEKDFFTGEHSGWPLKVLPIMKKPFINIGGEFYCFEYIHLFDNIYRVLQKIISKSKPEYKEIWNNKQKEISENIPFEFLKEILIHSEIIKPVYYKWYPSEQAKTKDWIENDGILICDDHLIIIEVKAGSFTPTSPFDDFDSHIKAIRDLLYRPWLQAKRFHEYLTSSVEVPLYTLIDGDYKPIKNICVSNFRHVSYCTVTLDNITHIASKVQSLSPLNINVSEYPVWSISIDDLMIFKDLFHTSIEFLHFLEQRNKAFKSKSILLDDEVNHLALYFKFNDYSSYAEDVSPITPIFQGYKEEIDRYYYNIAIHNKSTPKPRQEMPLAFIKIIELLSKQAKPGFTGAGSYLLDLDNQARKEISEHIPIMLQRQIDRSSYMKLSWIGDRALTMSCRIIDLMPRKTLIRDIALADVIGNKEEKRLFLELEFDNSLELINIDFELLTQSDVPEEPNEYLQKLYLNEQTKREQLILEKCKDVGSNELCPCGNQKKYKNCHGIGRI